MGEVLYDKLLSKLVLHRHDPLYLQDSGGQLWTVTIDTGGNLVTAKVVIASNTGQSYGLLLALTQP